MIYIYGLVCPHHGDIRYIGKTKNTKTRLAAHIAKAKGFHTNSHCANWIRSLLNNGTAPTMVVIEEIPDGGDWQRSESRAIAASLATGCNLTNLTSGGDGFHDMPSSVIEKRSAAWRKTHSDPVRMATFIESMNLVRNSPAVRKKQSDSMKSRWTDPAKKAALIDSMHTPEATATRSRATRRRHASPEYAAKHSAKMKEVCNTPEFREQQRQRSLKAWADPEITARRRLSGIKARSTPEYRANARKVNGEINSRTEVKALKSAKSKAYAADPVRFAGRLKAMSSEKTRTKMAASAKARWADPIKGNRSYLSTPERRIQASLSAINRSTPEYRAMMSEKTRQSWIERRKKSL